MNYTKAFAASVLAIVLSLPLWAEEVARSCDTCELQTQRSVVMSTSPEGATPLLSAQLAREQIEEEFRVWPAGLTAQNDTLPRSLPRTATHPMARWSLIFGICSLVPTLLSLAFAPLAIILGAKALGKMKTDPYPWRGRGLAIAGIVMGSISALVGLIALVVALVLLQIFFSWI